MAFPRGSVVKNLTEVQELQEMWVWSMNWEDILEKDMATHSSILARKIPRIEEPGYLQSIGWHNQTQLKWLSMHTQGCHTHTHTHIYVYSCCYSVAQLGLTLCESTDCSMPGFPVLHYLLELVQTHVHRIGDAIQPSWTLSSPCPPAFNRSQHQGLF